MRKLLLVAATLLAGFATVSTNLWLQLKAERRTSSELRTQLVENSTLAHGHAEAISPAGASVPVAAPNAPNAVAKPVLAQPDSDAAMRATSAAINAAVAAGVTGASEQDLMKDPEYRQAQLTVARLKLAQSNPGLAEALGISAKEANHLFEIMAEQQLKLTADLIAVNSNGGTVNAKAMDEVMQRARAAGDPVRDELGDARYAQYQQYQRDVRPALTQVASIGSSLTAAGQSLTETQSKGLASAMLAEQQRQRQEAAIPRTNPNPGAPPSLVQSIEEGGRRQEESNNRTVEAAAAYLNPAQLDVLKAKYQQQADQRRKTVESLKEAEARRPLPQPAAAPVNTF